jgi:putative membrane protein (TIGR04086 family)
MIQSIRAVLFGILLALGVGALVIFGIAAPFFTRFFGPELASTTLPAVILVFAAAFAFYFGGMLASYRAPSRRRLHGVLVGVVAFAISPIINLGASAIAAAANDPFANLRTPGALLFTCVLFVAVLLSSYVGARRGETLYAYNQIFIRRQERRKAENRLRNQE